jgi:hypothetical protein
MAYIPKGAKWYLAELVEEITVEDEPRNVVHTNVILVRADSPQEAYDRSLGLGKQSETSYENLAGRLGALPTFERTAMSPTIFRGRWLSLLLLREKSKGCTYTHGRRRAKRSSGWSLPSRSHKTTVSVTPICAERTS